MRLHVLPAVVGLGLVLGAHLYGKNATPASAPPKPKSAVIKWLTFSPDGKTLAAEEDSPRNVTLWDISTGTNITPHSSTQPAGPVLFSADGKTILLGDRSKQNENWALDRHQLKSYDVATGKTAPLSDSSWDLLGFSPDGKTEVIREHPWSVVFELRDLNSPFDETAPHAPAALKAADTTFISTAQFSSDSKMLAVMAKVGKPIQYLVMIWDIASRKNIANLPGGMGDRFQFSPDGKIMAIGNGKSHKLFDVVSGKETGVLECGLNENANANGLTPLRFSPDSKTVIGKVSDKGGPASPPKSKCLRAWSATTGKKILDLETSGGADVPMVFSADSQTLSGIFGRVVKRWNLSSGKGESFPILPAMKSVSLPVLSPDGSILAGGFADGTIKMWTVGPDATKVRTISPVISPARFK